MFSTVMLEAETGEACEIIRHLYKKFLDNNSKSYPFFFRMSKPSVPPSQAKPAPKPLTAEELKQKMKKEERARRFGTGAAPAKRGSSSTVDSTPPKVIKLNSSSDCKDDTQVGRVKLRNPNALKEAIASQNSSKNETATRQVDTSQGLKITTVNEKRVSSEDLKSSIEATVRKEVRECSSSNIMF